MSWGTCRAVVAEMIRLSFKDFSKIRFTILSVIYIYLPFNQKEEKKTFYLRHNHYSPLLFPLIHILASKDRSIEKTVSNFKSVFTDKELKQNTEEQRKYLDIRADAIIPISCQGGNVRWNQTVYNIGPTFQALISSFPRGPLNRCNTPPVRWTNTIEKYWWRPYLCYEVSVY